MRGCIGCSFVNARTSRRWFDLRFDPAALWYGGQHTRQPLFWLLLPLSWLYAALMRLRWWAYRRGWFACERLPVPIIVVGNLTVGGTGKTPMVRYLVELLRAQGWRPAIITRGYGGRASDWPQVVTPDSDPEQVGDEPVLLARRAGCVVVAGPDRVAAGRLALKLSGCDIVVSDDGLQHHRLVRDLEIALIDGVRELGNGRCLPAGPLREPAERLQHVDLVLYKGGQRWGQRLLLQCGELVNLRNPAQQRPLADCSGQRVRAVAGIGHPDLFFAQLEAAALVVEPWPYPDHHRYSAADCASWRGLPVVMTEKDAVKCAAFADADHWVLPVTAQLDAEIEAQLIAQIGQLRNLN